MKSNDYFYLFCMHSMNNKPYRHKDYFIDARIATAKKGRKGDKNVRSRSQRT